jgi:hypothetical protein
MSLPAKKLVDGPPSRTMTTEWGVAQPARGRRYSKPSNKAVER